MTDRRWAVCNMNAADNGDVLMRLHHAGGCWWTNRRLMAEMTSAKRWRRKCGIVQNDGCSNMVACHGGGGKRHQSYVHVIHHVTYHVICHVTYHLDGSRNLSRGRIPCASWHHVMRDMDSSRNVWYRRITWSIIWAYHVTYHMITSRDPSSRYITWRITWKRHVTCDVNASRDYHRTHHVTYHVDASRDISRIEEHLYCSRQENTVSSRVHEDWCHPHWQ